MRTAETSPVSATEAKSLFFDLDHLPALVLAVSGVAYSTISNQPLAGYWSTVYMGAGRV